MSIPTLKTLKRHAYKSNHKAYKHSAMVVSGGRIMSIGINFDRHHAEVNALKKLWPCDRRGVTVISVRFTLKTGKLAMAKPCNECQKFLVDSGVKRVIYSDSDGSMKEFKL